MQKYVLAVVGSREFRDYETLCFEINEIRKIMIVSKIVSGGAQGADSLGAKYANAQGIELVEIKPDWNKYGRKAGILRNEDIVVQSDVVLAFWDGKSPGTKNTIDRANKLEKVVKIVYF